MVKRRFSGGIAASLLALNALAADPIAEQVDAWLAAYRDNLLTELNDPGTSLAFRVTALDPRLQLAPCDVPLDIRARDGEPLSRRLTLEVSCPSGTRWRIYVPVAVSLSRPVVVALRPLPRGTQVTASDVQLRELDVANIHGSYYLNEQEVVGQVVKRNIRADDVLLHSSLSPPLMVSKGDEVIISAVSNGLQVKVPGTALSDGRAGEQIAVRNRSSQRIIDARVTGPGQVEVAM
ncbi:MAG TPA: flagellar basal body P-ring formation chaperone FlgA [Spongiibacteraceae bacterium]|jgi:flagella basal body P-ring formation protein FlgA|nr:flagellar basal body P-ring formation chaperone FlgA [Spongiibacteraceae bacterium]HUH36996.1 flagellar basal body P-ring formation chaperone FlgA [Spongiibacteraceae bacterium]